MNEAVSTAQETAPASHGSREQNSRDLAKVGTLFRKVGPCSVIKGNDSCSVSDIEEVLGWINLLELRSLRSKTSNAGPSCHADDIRCNSRGLIGADNLVSPRRLGEVKRPIGVFEQ